MYNPEESTATAIKNSLALFRNALFGSSAEAIWPATQGGNSLFSEGRENFRQEMKLDKLAPEIFSTEGNVNFVFPLYSSAPSIANDIVDTPRCFHEGLAS